MTTAWLALAVCVLLGSGVAPSTRVAALTGAARLASGGIGRVAGVHLFAPSASAVALGAGVLLMGTATWRGGLPLGLAAASIDAMALVLIRDRQRHRDRARRQADLAEAVRVLVAELDSGARPRAALEAAAAVGPSHRAVFAASAELAASGSDAAEPLLSNGDLRPVGVAWRLGQATGLALSGVLTRVAADLDAQADQRRTVAVALSGPRSSAAVLTGLPVIGIVMGIAMGADPVGFLMDSPAGRAVCCVGVLLDLGGVLWVRRIVRSAARG